MGDVVLEETVMCGGGGELSYCPHSGQRAALLVGEVYSHYPETLSHPFPPLETWSLIGKSSGNASNGGDTVIQITVEDDLTPELLAHLRCATPPAGVDSYSLKFNLSRHEIVCKCYYANRDLRNLLQEKIPIVDFAGEFGLHLNKPIMEGYVDASFITDKDGDELASLLQVAIPRTQIDLYGCVVDMRSFKVVRIKGYRYPEGRW